MIKLVLMIAALLPLSAFAQLEVFVFDGTNDTPLTALTTVGPVAPGDMIETRFHIRNMGSGPASLSGLTLGGAAFTIVSAPSLPYVLEPYVGPASEVEFDVIFSPEITGMFGAFLGVNSLNFALQGISVSGDHKFGDRSWSPDDQESADTVFRPRMMARFANVLRTEGERLACLFREPAAGSGNDGRANTNRSFDPCDALINGR